MTRIIAFVSLLLSLLGLAGTAYADRPKTYFDYIERAWACADIELRKPLEHRDGLVLAYPGTLVDVAYSRHGNPQSILLVEELTSKEDKSPVSEGELFFAPIQVLPEHSYWRDNLPNTPRHGVLGGRRYIFKGEDAAAAKALTKTYAESFKMQMPEKRMRQQAVVVGALTSGVKVLREDAIRRLTTMVVPAKQYDDATIRSLGDYVKSDAPTADRAQIAIVIGQAGMNTLVPDLEVLAKKNDVVAASALQALEQLGAPRSTEVLFELLSKEPVEVRSYAAHELGKRSDQDAKAYARASEIMTSDGDANVRGACAMGLGASGKKDALTPLRTALERGDEASRPAGAAIARIGGKEAGEILKEAIRSGPSEAQVAAVLAMVEMRGDCEKCAEFLLEQKTSNPDAGVRDLIGIVLELNVKHDH
jgi:HEAT repeat protein